VRPASRRTALRAPLVTRAVDQSMHDPDAAFMHSRWIITVLMEHSALTPAQAFVLRCAPR
jgi:hypothetical protein